MDNIKNDEYYLSKIKYCLDRINSVMKNVSYEEFVKDENIQEIAMFNLIQISENARLISEEYKTKKHKVPWNDIYGLRNRIVHDYGNVILDIVYTTLVKDIPQLYEELYK